MKLIIFVLLFLPLVSYSDSWSPPEPIAAIDNTGKYILKTHSGNDLESVWGYGGEKNGKSVKNEKNAKFEVYRFNEKTKRYDFLSEFISNNPISPVYVFISKYGNITSIDNWHNMGIGKVITIYTFRGTVKNSYSLGDIFNKKELKKIPESASSLHWRCSEPYYDKYNDTIIIQSFNEEIITVNPNNGSITKEKEYGVCKKT